jgi:hypothetical protein
MSDTAIASAILIVFLGVATLLLRILWRQRKRDAATIAQLQADSTDTTAYLKQLGAVIDADGELLRHVAGIRRIARILASDGQPLLEQQPVIAVFLKESDDYLGRVLAAVAENKADTIAEIRYALDRTWTVEQTYGPLAPYLERTAS